MLGGKKIKPPKMQDELLSTEQKLQKPVQDIKENGGCNSWL